MISKRLLRLLLVTLILSLVLVACGGTTSEPASEAPAEEAPARLRAGRVIQVRDRAHAVLVGDGGALVDVELADVESVVLRCDLFENWCDDPARATPFRPVIHQNGVIALQYLLFKTVIGDVYYTDTFGACRSGCSRTHKGNDIMSSGRYKALLQKQPLFAASYL